MPRTSSSRPQPASAPRPPGAGLWDGVSFGPERGLRQETPPSCRGAGPPPRASRVGGPPFLAPDGPCRYERAGVSKMKCLIYNVCSKAETMGGGPRGAWRSGSPMPPRGRVLVKEGAKVRPREGGAPRRSPSRPRPSPRRPGSLQAGRTATSGGRTRVPAPRPRPGSQPRSPRRRAGDQQGARQACPASLTGPHPVPAINGVTGRCESFHFQTGLLLPHEATPGGGGAPRPWTRRPLPSRPSSFSSRKCRPHPRPVFLGLDPGVPRGGSPRLSTRGP